VEDSLKQSGVFGWNVQEDARMDGRNIGDRNHKGREREELQ
jgi:hypothetical protein